jgi:hypothetical protein
VWQHKEEGIRFFLQEKNYLTNPSARNFRTTPNLVFACGWATRQLLYLAEESKFGAT